MRVVCDFNHQTEALTRKKTTSDKHTSTSVCNLSFLHCTHFVMCTYSTIIANELVQQNITDTVSTAPALVARHFVVQYRLVY